MTSPNSRLRDDVATTEASRAAVPVAGPEAKLHAVRTRRELRSVAEVPAHDVPRTRAERARQASARPAVTESAEEVIAPIAQTIAHALVVEAVAAEAAAPGVIAVHEPVDVEAFAMPTSFDHEPVVSEDEAPAPRWPVPTPVAEDVTAEPIALPAATPSGFVEDEFAAASRLFADSGTTAPVEIAPAPVAEGEEEPAVEAEHVAPHRRRRFNTKRITTTALSVGVVGCIVTLTVAMAFPAAPAGNNTDRVVASSIADDAEIQAFVAPSEVQNSDIERMAGFESVTAAQIAAETGIRYSSDVFTNDPTRAIQWPFAVGTGMSYGYGMRDGRMHEGIDFTPGEGAPIQAIADGTVRIATENGGGYGVTAYIDHVIDGQTITSHYSHMLNGSLEVTAGQKVKVGDIVGLTGDTGHSFGAHLHFELMVNGATIDPMPWLKEHAG